MYSPRDSIEVYVENEEEEPSGAQNILDLFVKPPCIGLIVLIVIIVVILILLMSYGRHRRVEKSERVYESQPPIHGEIEAERAIGPLNQALADEDEAVKKAAKEALENIGGGE